ncbi:hypothetical protein PIN31115_04514 [Pandoraea iniqua]|uniref:Type III secretion protein HrpB4 n=1 Tax=Pandoraea iniqua TaxID=2508288 RepID=A0A5E4YIP5_9BURK|nr:hypothetical protein [Pandoraea iniqua]VVE48310.1 hypothetical protein PIN31115_04514 [Pandoraea iniqua]
MSVLSHESWQHLLAPPAPMLTEVHRFVHVPAQGALPSRIAQALDVPIDAVSNTLPGAELAWSRQLLKHHATEDLDASLPDDEHLRFACQSTQRWQALAIYLGARRLAPALRQRVLKSELDAVLEVTGAPALRYARTQAAHDPLALNEAHDWSAQRLAESLRDVGLVCLEHLLLALPTALRWRAMLRIPPPRAPEAAFAAQALELDVTWPIGLSLAKELNPSCFS